MGWFDKPKPTVQKIPAPEPGAKANALAEELALVLAEDAFAALQAKGQALRDKKIKRAFSTANTAAEYQAAVRLIPPAVANEDKLALRELRAEYRLKYRKPIKNGAAPGPAATASVVPKAVS